MSTSFPTQGHHIVYICSNIIFQILPPCSRPMTSHHVTCHVTAVSHASSLSKRKIKEKKNKIVSVQASHNNIFLVGILSDFFFSNTFKYLWNLLGAISSTILISIKSSSFSCFFFIILVISISFSTVSFLNSFFFSFFFFCSFFFYFCHPYFICFIFYYFPYSSRHLIIFISSIFQSISELWCVSHNISNITLYFCSLSDTVYTGMKVYRMDLEMSELVKQPWLQLMYCTICLPCGCNFR